MSLTELGWNILGVVSTLLAYVTAASAFNHRIVPWFESTNGVSLYTNSLEVYIGFILWPGVAAVVLFALTVRVLSEVLWALLTGPATLYEMGREDIRKEKNGVV